MKKYLSVILLPLLSLLVSGAIFYWGFVNDGYVRMIIGIILILVTIKVATELIYFVMLMNRWLKKNQGKLVLFYPTKKLIQDKIKAEFIPEIPHEILEVYYNGPQIDGDIQPSIAIELMKWNRSIQIHQPSIFKVVDKSLVIESLNELNRIAKEKIDFKPLLTKIDKVNKA